MSITDLGGHGDPERYHPFYDLPTRALRSTQGAHRGSDVPDWSGVFARIKAAMVPLSRFDFAEYAEDTPAPADGCTHGEAPEPEYVIVQPGLDGVAWLGEVWDGEVEPIGKVADLLSAYETWARDVSKERRRAHAKHGAQSMESTPWIDPTGQRYRILLEEVGEVAKALNEWDLGHLRPFELKRQLDVELLQVATMAIAWREAVLGRPLITPED